jgi:multidrug efflux system membrane fusion protein
LARAKSALDTAKADVARIKLRIDRTQVKAPFAGVINKRLVETGDYVGIGDPILELADLDPLIVRANVTQQEVLKLVNGQEVSASIVTGKKHQGTIRYIAPVADENTNTFVIEAAFANPNMQFKAGFSTQLDIELAEVNAILLSPAFMALDDNGNIGVKTLSTDNTVLFTPINIVKSEQDGVWMTGLGENTKVITLGQGFVRIGDKVDPSSATQGAN